MTEHEWLTSTDPAAMLQLLSLSNPAFPALKLISDRKLRLFACACCRQVWHLLDADSRRAVEVAERYADGGPEIEFEQIGWQTRTGCAITGATESVTRSLLFTAEFGLSSATQAALLREIVSPFSPVVLPKSKRKCGRCKGERRVWDDSPGQSIFDNYRMDCPDCKGTGSVEGDCPWLTSTVTALAQAAYEERLENRCPVSYPHMPHDYCDGTPAPHVTNGTLDPDRLAILADCAEEAGCTDERVLRHLRGWERHVCKRDCGNRHLDCCELAGGDGWLRRTVPFFRGDAILDLFLNKE